MRNGSYSQHVWRGEGWEAAIDRSRDAMQEADRRREVCGERERVGGLSQVPGCRVWSTPVETTANCSGISLRDVNRQHVYRHPGGVGLVGKREQGNRSQVGCLSGNAGQL